MDLTWLDPDSLAERDVSGAVALLEAARAVDRPYRPSPTVTSFTVRMRHGWDGDRPAAALLRDPRGRVVGLLEVYLSTWDNTHVGYIEITIDPGARRQGLGRRLFGIGEERVRAAGRTLLLITTLDEPAGVAFAKAMRMERAYEEISRVQDLTALDWAQLDQEYQRAQRHAAGYELVRVPGATPESMMAAVVRITAAINDAPTDDLAIEDEVFTPDRIRAFEAGEQARQRRVYRLLARERETGMLAGHTVVAVEGEQPWHAWQYDTSVLEAHRGHRLGLLLKIGMLRWLAAEEPQLRSLHTGNAAANTHMIKVNEILGYRVLNKAIEWQRQL